MVPRYNVLAWQNYRMMPIEPIIRQGFILALKPRIPGDGAANSSINTPRYLGRLLISLLRVASGLNMALINRPRSLSLKEKRLNAHPLRTNYV